MFYQTDHNSTRNRRIKRAIASHCQSTNFQPTKRRFIKGFTLLELIIIILIISILFATMAPGWSAFMTAQRLNVAQNSVLQAMRDAQSRAKQNRIVWQASFQNPSSTVQWAIHPANITPSPALWSNLDPNVQIDNETTLQQVGGLRRVQFDHEGNVDGQLGRLTLSTQSNSKIKRCVIVSTLLGALRTGSDHTTLQDGKSCY